MASNDTHLMSPSKKRIIGEMINRPVTRPPFGEATKGKNESMAQLYAMCPGALWGAFKAEKVAFWLVCLYLMFEYVRPQSLYQQLDVLPFGEVTIVLAIAVCVFEGACRYVRNAINGLIIIFFLVIILSGIFSYWPRYAFESMPLFLPWMVIYFMIITIVNNERKFLIFWLLFLLFTFKMSQHGFFSWAESGFRFRTWGIVGGPGWFRNSGEIGIQLCIILPMSIYFIVALREHWGKGKLLFFLLIPFTAIIAAIGTSSRGTLLAMGGALLWMLLKSQAKGKGLFWLIVVGLLAWSFLPEQQIERLHSAGEDETSVSRLTYWVRGLGFMNEHPILGIGYGNWLPYYRSQFPGEWTEVPHNIFIQAGAELGYTGLFVFLLMIVYVLINNYRTRAVAQRIGNRFLYYSAHALDAALIAFLIGGFFVTVLYYPFFWINLAFTTALHNVARKEESRQGVAQGVEEIEPGINARLGTEGFG